MAFDIEPRNPEAGIYGFPNAFWNAFCVETPVSQVIDCEYTDHDTIRYEHDGYMGGHGSARKKRWKCTACSSSS